MSDSYESSLLPSSIGIAKPQGIFMYPGDTALNRAYERSALLADYFKKL